MTGVSEPLTADELAYYRGPFKMKWQDKLRLLDEVERLREENAQLRRIIKACARKGGEV